MYNVNQSLIESRLACIPEISEAMSDLTANWQGTLVQGLVQERALHLALEIVTDVGSALIDGYLMRDASSYEDIIDIIAMEQVITPAVTAPVKQLVGLRKALVQEYDSWQRRELHELTVAMPQVLQQFDTEVRSYLLQEFPGGS